MPNKQLQTFGRVNRRQIINTALSGAFARVALQSQDAFGQQKPKTSEPDAARA